MEKHLHKYRMATIASQQKRRDTTPKGDLEQILGNRKTDQIFLFNFETINYCLQFMFSAVSV